MTPKIQVEAWQCFRCGHVWLSESKEKPTACGKCKSKYWDIPRRASEESQGKKHRLKDSNIVKTRKVKGDKVRG